MKRIPFTRTPTSITLVVDSRHRQIDRSHANFNRVADQLKFMRTITEEAEYGRAVDQLRTFIDIPAFVALVTEGRVQISKNEVRVDGQTTHGHIAERLLEMLREGFDVLPLARMLQRLDDAPIKNVKDQFLRWLEKSHMPLTEDGCVIAYKYVREDYTDGWSGRIDNHVGAVIQRLEVNSVNADPENTCAASGYHFCSFGYLHGQQPRIMLVKIAPEDVCSFPSTEEAKGRCLFYEIIDEVPSDELPGRRVEQSPMYPAPEPGYDARDLHEDEQDDEPEDEAEDEADGDGEEDTANHPTIHANRLEDGAPKKVVVAKNLSPRELWKARLEGKELGGRPLTQRKLLKLVGKHGQRKAALLTGIPRTTMQGWLE